MYDHFSFYVHGLVRRTHWVQVFTRACRADVTIRNVTIKTPDRKYDRGREWSHTRKRRAEDFEIWKDSWDSSLEEGSRFLVSPRRDQLGVYEMCLSQWVESWWCTNSQLRKKILSLSIKSFVPEPISSVCWSLYALWIWIMHVNILVVFMGFFISPEKPGLFLRFVKE